MNEVALFTSALRAAVPAQPDPRLGAKLVPRLAQAGRAATIEAESQASRRGAATGAAPRSRLALVARVGIVVALVPLALAGLAFAGVNLPQPARDAFDSAGLTLPNQESSSSEKATTTEQQPQQQQQPGGNEVSDAARSGPAGKGGNSAVAHRHARNQRAKARGKALGHSRGKAIGLNDLAPPRQSHETGPPAHSNAGGSPKNHSSQSAPHGNPHPSPPPQSPPPQSRGRSR